MIPLAHLHVPVHPLVLLVGCIVLVFAIRSGKYKLIEGLGSGGFSQTYPPNPVPGGPTDQLYNLTKDPGEKKNRFLALPKVVARLRMELEQVRSSE